MKLATQVIVAVAVAASISSAFLSMSSPQGAFSVLNQFQLFILLPMIGAYIPPKVIDIITGMSFSMISFSFLPIEKIPFATDLFDYDQNADYFDDIGLTSGSSLLNHLGLLAMLMLLILPHCIIGCCHFISTLTLDENNCFRKTIKKVSEFLTLSAYVRLGMESFLFICISSAAEAYQLDTKTTFKSISLIFSYLLSLLLILFVFLCLWETIRHISRD